MSDETQTPAIDAADKAAMLKHLTPPSEAFKDFLEQDALKDIFPGIGACGVTNRTLLESLKIDMHIVELIFCKGYMDGLFRLKAGMIAARPELKKLDDAINAGANQHLGRA